MKISKTVKFDILMALLAILAVAWGVWIFLPSGSCADERRETYSARRGIKDLGVDSGRVRRDRIRGDRIAEPGRRDLSVKKGRRAADDEDVESTKKDVSEIMESLSEFLEEELTAEQRKMILDIRAALDDNDKEKILAFARLAAKSPSSTVRMAAVEAAGWFGDDALPELTEFLADADPEVAQEALDRWEEAIRECEDEAEIIQKTMLGMMAIKDESACDYLSMNFIKSGEPQLAVEAITELMAGNNEACKGPAKEAYEWITDNPWTNEADAQSWIAQQNAKDAAAAAATEAAAAAAEAAAQVQVQE